MGLKRRRNPARKQREWATGNKKKTEKTGGKNREDRGEEQEEKGRKTRDWKGESALDRKKKREEKLGGRRRRLGRKKKERPVNQSTKVTENKKPRSRVNRKEVNRELNPSLV